MTSAADISIFFYKKWKDIYERSDFLLKMYRLVYFLGLLIRQFCLPNPFTPLGGTDELINLVAGALFVPLSYAQVSVVYSKGSNPALGSFLFTIMYAVNTGAAYLIMLLFPIQWLVVMASVLYLFVSFSFLFFINNRICY